MVLAGNTAGITETSTLKILPWRESIPRKLLLSSARCGHQSADAPYGQFAVAIDFNRAAFDAGVPPWYQTRPDGSYTDWDENLTLVSLFSHPREPIERTRDWHTPVLFDADKDLLWIQQDAADDIWWTQLAFLVPCDFTPLPYPVPIVPPPPPEPGWQTVAQVTPDTVASYGGWTASTVVPAGTTAGSKTRITLLAGPGGCTLDSLTVGPRTSGHAAASLAQMLSAPVVFAPNEFKTFEVAQGYAGSIVVRAYYSAGNVQSHIGPATGWSTAFKAGDYSNTSADVFTAGSAASNGVMKVEQFF